MDMNFLTRSKELQNEIVTARRTIHQFGGIGFDLEESAQFIKRKLIEWNIDFKEICKCGIVATVGNGEPVFLIRGDFDALPIVEKSGLPFAATNGSSHSCGHDFHASMLLYAAKMLKENEATLNGTVKVMFQPAEEGAGGCKTMVEAGILENPKVDSGMAIHVAVGNELCDACTIHYSRGPAFASGAGVKIKVKGKGGHGAQPHTAIDPITASASIITSLQHIIAMEVASDERAVLTFGKIQGGSASNVITDYVEFAGTCRTYTEKMADFMHKRVVEVTENVAKAMRVEVEIDYKQGGKAVFNDPALCDELYPFIQEVCGNDKVLLVDRPTSYGGEDFSEITQRVPALVLKLGVGSPKEGYVHPIHHPSAVFNEDALAYGAAIYANCAYLWLKQNQK